MFLSVVLFIAVSSSSIITINARVATIGYPGLPPPIIIDDQEYDPLIREPRQADSTGVRIGVPEQQQQSFIPLVRDPRQTEGEEVYVRPLVREPRETDTTRERFSTPDEEPEPHIRERRQAFGGVNTIPGIGRTQTFGYQAGPAWGSATQSFNNAGVGSPITFSGGAGTVSPAGHGISGRFDTQPGIGSHGQVRGQVGILNNPGHQVTGWAQHDRNFDRHLNTAGPATNSAGLNYLNKNNGAGAFVHGSRTSGQPNTGSVGGNVPIFIGNGGRTRLDGVGQSNFGQGMKPSHEVGLKFSHNF